MSDSAQSAYWLSSDPDNDDDDDPDNDDDPDHDEDPHNNYGDQNRSSSSNNINTTTANKTCGKKRCQQEVDLTESTVKKS